MRLNGAGKTKEVCGRQWLKMVIYMLPIILLYVLIYARIPLFLGEKTPASIGVWMGIMMIDEYMKKHPDMTIEDLLAKTDYHQMLVETDFKP